jgi:hypothetical protein
MTTWQYDEGKKAVSMRAISVYTDSGQPILVSVSENVDLVSGAAGGGTIAEIEGASRTVRRLEDVGATIADVCRSVQQKVMTAIREAGPSELTLEFGVKLAGEAAIPLVTSSSIEGTFQVTAKWDFAEK